MSSSVPDFTPPLVVFDLDGTLLDTAPDLVAALNAVLIEAGLPPAAYDDVAAFAGQGAQALLDTGFALAGRELSADDAEPLRRRLVAIYAGAFDRGTRPYPGAVEAIDRLAAHGVRFAVCTNKPVSLAEPLLAAFDLRRRLAAVIGGDSLPVRKPDPDHLLGTIIAAGGRPNRSVMVGDGAADILAARAAGVPSVAVRFGYCRERLEDLAPDAIIDRYDDLDDALRIVSSIFANLLQ
jgi:phosphoglycolate phosphatase